MSRLSKRVVKREGGQPDGIDPVVAVVPQEMPWTRWFQSLAVLAALAACVPAGEGAFNAKGDPEEGAKVFLRRCKVCHWIGEGAKNRKGPHLNGVVGREIASVEGFDYSDAFLAKKVEGLVWTEKNLQVYPYE